MSYDIEKTVKTIWIIATLIVVLAVAGVVTFILNRATLEASLGTEVFKLTYQFLLIVVVGGAVTLLFTQFSKVQEEKSKERERIRLMDKEKKDRQRKFHADIIQAHNGAKRVRRLLRARARILTEGGEAREVSIKYSTYSKLMQTLIDVQLQFETLYEEAKSHPNLFSGVSGISALENDLAEIESYLNKIVKEYEGGYKSPLDDTGLKRLKDLPRLDDFIKPFKESEGFREKYKYPADRVVDGMLKILLNDKK